MKSVIVLIATILIVLTINGAHSISYLEMTPYLESSCGGESQGVGYALAIGECFAIAGDYYYVTLSSDHGNATVSNYGDDSTCKAASPTQKSYSTNDCYDAPNYVWDNAVVPNNYVLISISVNPTTIPQYGYRQTTYADNQCQSNPQFYWYATNDTVIKSSGESSTFFCVDDTPYETFCNPGCDTDNNNLDCVRDFIHWSTHNYVQGSC